MLDSARKAEYRQDEHDLTCSPNASCLSEGNPWRRSTANEVGHTLQNSESWALRSRERPRHRYWHMLKEIWALKGPPRDIKRTQNAKFDPFTDVLEFQWRRDVQITSSMITGLLKKQQLLVHEMNRFKEFGNSLPVSMVLLKLDQGPTLTHSILWASRGRRGKRDSVILNLWVSH